MVAFSRLVDVCPSQFNYTGALPRRDKPGKRFGFYRDRFKAIPRIDWDDLLVELVPTEPLIQKTKNQKSEGTCTSNAYTQGFEGLFVLQFGVKEWVELSALSLYQRCASNPDSGSTLPDNLDELCRRGILPTDSPWNRERFGDSPHVRHYHANTGFYDNPLPKDWQETAQYFRADEEDVADVFSFDELFSALLQGFFVVYARAGHCILGVTPVKRNGVYYIKYKNSWGQWGENGYGYDSESFVTPGIRLYGALTMRSLIIPPWYQMVA